VWQGRNRVTIRPMDEADAERLKAQAVNAQTTWIDADLMVPVDDEAIALEGGPGVRRLDYRDPKSGGDVTVHIRASADTADTRQFSVTWSAAGGRYARVTLWRTGGPVASQRVGATGRTEFDDVPRGPARLVGERVDESGSVQTEWFLLA